MLELTNSVVQEVAAGQSVVFNSTSVKSGCAERHREGSGQITLTKPGRYLVTFSGNIAIPSGGTVGEIALGIAQAGEIIGGTLMRSTPTAVENFNNVSSQTYVNVYCNCCETVTIKNAGINSVSVDNPNITAVRVCG